MTRFGAILTLLILLGFGALSPAVAGCGNSNPNCIVPTAPYGTSNNQAASTAFVQGAVTGGGIVTTSLPTVVNCVPVWSTTVGALLGNDCALSVNGSYAASIGTNTAAITADGAQFTEQNSSTTAQSIYAPITSNAGLQYFDGSRSVINVPANSTAYNIGAFGCYILDNSGTSTLHSQTVGSATCNFGINIANANNAGVWGFSYYLGDSSNNTTNASTGKVLDNELDFGVYSNGTTVEGLSFALGGLAQPLNSSGIQFSASGTDYITTNPIQWGNALVFNSGCCTVPLTIGATSASGDSLASMPINFYSTNSGGAVITNQIKTFNNAFFFLQGALANYIEIVDAATTATPEIFAGGTDTNVNLGLTCKGTCNVVADAPFIISGGSAITSSGPGGALGSNAFTSTAYAPLASPVFTGTPTGPNFTATAAAPTVSASQIGYGGTVTANTSCGTLSGSAGCVVINVAGIAHYMPYY